MVSQHWMDRIIQGSIRRTLNARFKHILSDASYAYSEGKGALRAAHRIVQHRDAGRIWVLRGDIHAFFASLPHDLMISALEPHLDPQACRLVQAILRTPVREGSSLIQPEIGLLEGGVLSPLMANIYLNPFDQELSQPPAGLVRFADDFAILASSARVIGEKLEQAENLLNRLRLRLNTSKTRIVSFEQGFDFLGFRFQGRSVRVSPERVEQFKAHIEHLLNPRFGSGSKAGIREANDLIRGWRNYFQLGEVASDFRMLEDWLRDRFGAIAEQLERLVPEANLRKAPELGGYQQRKRRNSFSKTADQTTQTRPGPPSGSGAVTRDAGGKPQLVLRGSGWLEVAGLAPLPKNSHLEQVLTQLHRAGLYHRAVVSSRWAGPAAAEAASLCAAALAGRVSLPQAQTAYEAALAEAAGCDVRQPRGMVRRALRMESWTALLEAGLDIGPEAGMGIPTPATVFAEAFEPLTSDHGLLHALKVGKNPNFVFTATLGLAINYRGQKLSWQQALRLEARQLVEALQGQAYLPFLWGQR